jgi:hypothetical protein
MPYAVSEATQYRLETAEWEASLERSRQRRHEERAEQPPSQTMDAQTASWVEWVDARIDQKCAAVIEAVDEALGKMFDAQHENVQSALNQRDAKIEDLRRELDVKIGLKARVDRLKSEITEARAQAPNFKAELKVLQEKTARQEKLITRLRGQASQLEYAQKQLGDEQRKDRRETSVTITKLTTFGSQTSEVLRHLCAEAGLDLTGADYERLN